MLAANKKWVFLITLSIVWGSSFILMKKALLGLTPIQLGALRIFISGIFIFLIGSRKLKALKRKEWKWISISGILGTFFPAFLFAIAETEIDSAVASILNSLVPLNTILLGFAVFRIASTRRQVLGVIIGFIGTAILILKGAELNPGQNYLYAGFVIGSTIMYALNVNIIKTHLQFVKPLAIAAGNYVVIVVPAILVLLFSGFFSAKTLENPHFKMSLVFVTILSFFGTALAKVLFNKLIHISTPVFASSVTYLMPIVALTWGVLDGESFTLLQGFATLIILLGVYLSHKRQR